MLRRRSRSARFIPGFRRLCSAALASHDDGNGNWRIAALSAVAVTDLFARSLLAPVVGGVFRRGLGIKRGLARSLSLERWLLCRRPAMTNQGFSAMTIRSSSGGQLSAPMFGEESERARIVAAFMALFVEQSIKKIDFGAGVSLAQLREDFGSTIAVLTTQVEQIDRRVLAGESVEMAERVQGLAMLLSAVLRTWLDGADADLAGIVSALDRAGVWAAPRTDSRSMA